MLSEADAADELKTRAATYLNAADLARLDLAHQVAHTAHAGQVRKSGEHYIVHPLSVAALCTDLKLDADALIAAVLHDCVEDSALTVAEVQATFGKPVADLVDGLTKLENLKIASREEQQAENFRKMLLAMSKDIRVMMVKLCDRLHNMRTLQSLNAERQKRIARETMDIYAQVAHRLGLNDIYRELQDLSFRYLYPLRYATLSKAVNASRATRTTLVERTRRDLYEALKLAGLSAIVTGREKTLFSIYRKMQRKSLSFAEVSDVFGFRVAVDNEAQCYLALGAVHKAFAPIPGRIKDFIAIPKRNGYQSLHTTLMGQFGTQFEVQIRSQAMHRVAENGLAAHWLYKTTDLSADVKLTSMEWVRSLLSLDAGGDAKEFLEHVKVDLYPDAVYVFTPKNKIINLPRGATALDFAYAVHSDIGNSCIGAKVNEQDAPLRTVLTTGDRVEVFNSAGAKPNPAWLTFARTAKARAEIRHYLRTLKAADAIAQGEKMLGFALAQLKTNLSEISQAHWASALHDLGAKSGTEVMQDIAYGKRPAALIAQILLRRDKAITSDVTISVKKSTNVITEFVLPIGAANGVAVKYAPCCQPISEDDIVARFGQDVALMIHTADCVIAQRSRVKDPEHWLEVRWDAPEGAEFATRIAVTVKNTKGALAQVAGALSEAGVNIGNIHSAEEPNMTVINTITVYVKGRKHLAEVFKRLRHEPLVLGIERAVQKN